MDTTEAGPSLPDVEGALRVSQEAERALEAHVELSERRLAAHLRLAASAKGADILTMSAHAQQCMQLQQQLADAKEELSALIGQEVTHQRQSSPPIRERLSRLLGLRSADGLAEDRLNPEMWQKRGPTYGRNGPFSK